MALDSILLCREPLLSFPLLLMLNLFWTIGYFSAICKHINVSLKKKKTKPSLDLFFLSYCCPISLFPFIAYLLKRAIYNSCLHFLSFHSLNPLQSASDFIQLKYLSSNLTNLMMFFSVLILLVFIVAFDSILSLGYILLRFWWPSSPDSPPICLYCSLLPPLLLGHILGCLPRLCPVSLLFFLYYLTRWFH